MRESDSHLASFLFYLDWSGKAISKSLDFFVLVSTFLRELLVLNFFTHSQKLSFNNYILSLVEANYIESLTNFY